jgi:two-component system chemotaxis response regulator CheY
MLDETPKKLVRTVLIVDDADSCAAVLEITLNAIPGINIVRLSSGEEALRLLDDPALHVCAIVTDLNMPTVDGFELISRVRSDLRYSKIPIVVVSGDVDPGTPKRVDRLGVEAFFAKPYSPAVVRRSIQRLLDGAGE